jgi:hypothetical protein
MLHVLPVGLQKKLESAPDVCRDDIFEDLIFDYEGMALLSIISKGYLEI